MSKEQTLAFMQTIESITGFTFKNEEGKTRMTDECKEFLRSIGAAQFFNELPAKKGAAVIAALQEEARRREAAKQAEATEGEPKVPDIEDPYADQ